MKDSSFHKEIKKNYILDERILKNILKEIIKCVNNGEKLKLNISYKNLKLKFYNEEQVLVWNPRYSIWCFITFI